MTLEEMRCCRRRGGGSRGRGKAVSESFRWRKRKLGLCQAQNQQHKVYLCQGSGLGSEIWSWAEFLWTDEERQTDCGGSPSPEQTVKTVRLKTTFQELLFTLYVHHN